MGIDVWATRHRPELSALEPTPEATTAQVEVTTVQPTFRFLFMHYGKLGICCSLPPTGQSVPPEIRRFSDDVSFAVQVGSVIPDIVELRWPLIASSAVEQPLSAARALVQQNLKKLPDCVILFGTAFAGYALDVEDIAIGACQQAMNRQILVVDDIQTYVGNAGQKKELWSFINQARLTHGNRST